MNPQARRRRRTEGEVLPDSPAAEVYEEMAPRFRGYPRDPSDGSVIEGGGHVFYEIAHILQSDRQPDEGI